MLALRAGGGGGHVLAVGYLAGRFHSSAGARAEVIVSVAELADEGEDAVVDRAVGDAHVHAARDVPLFFEALAGWTTGAGVRVEDARAVFSNYYLAERRGDEEEAPFTLHTVPPARVA